MKVTRFRSMGTKPLGMRASCLKPSAAPAAGFGMAMPEMLYAPERLLKDDF